jgi:hypothetical protein
MDHVYKSALHPFGWPVIAGLMLLLSVSSCKIDRKETIDRDKFSFKLHDDNRLFFRNVRQYYYEFTNIPAVFTEVYRYGNRYKGNDRPMIYPTIVMNWEKNEAYLLIEHNDVLMNEDVLRIREKNKQNGRFYEYQLSERGRENMLEFATKIYEGLMAENVIEIQAQGQYKRLFLDDDDRESFRIVMGDFYRLTRMF